MHTRVARYGYTGDPHDLARRAEEGMLPAFQSSPGFKGYTLLETGGEIISISSWDSAESAEQANALAVEWISENMAGEIQLKDAAIGEVLFSTILGVTSRASA